MSQQREGGGQEGQGGVLFWGALSFQRPLDTAFPLLPILLVCSPSTGIVWAGTTGGLLLHGMLWPVTPSTLTAYTGLSQPPRQLVPRPQHIPPQGGHVNNARIMQTKILNPHRGSQGLT